MDSEIIKEAIGRIRGLPTVSRIRKELTENFQLRISEDDLEDDLGEMLEGGEIEERVTTIKGNKFRGYKLVKETEKEKSGKEKKTREEEIIEEIFS